MDEAAPGETPVSPTSPVASCALKTQQTIENLEEEYEQSTGKANKRRRQEIRREISELRETLTLEDIGEIREVTATMPPCAHGIAHISYLSCGLHIINTYLPCKAAHAASMNQQHPRKPLTVVPVRRCSAWTSRSVLRLKRPRLPSLRLRQQLQRSLKRRESGWSLKCCWPS